LEDGRYLNESWGVGRAPAEADQWSEVVWDHEEEFEEDDEFVAFWKKTTKEVDDQGWVHTSNPEVYGYDEESFELCGREVSCADVNAYCQYDGDEDPGPFCLDLTEGPSLAYATLEPNFHNNDGSTVVLYFDGVPSEEQVKQVLRDEAGGRPLWVSPDDPEFAFEEHPTPVSERGKLRRYEVYPAG
jgi:hypothetical protein